MLLALLMFLTVGVFQTQSPLAKPWIYQIRVVDDTVWFEGERGYDSVQVRYCFTRRAGTWCRHPRPAAPDRGRSRIPRRSADSVILAPGLALVCRSPVAIGGDCEAFGVHASGSTTVQALTPRAETATLAMLQRAAGLETDQPPSMSESISAWVAADDAIWFGLGGGFPEGYGAYGGLLRFDRARRTVETIVYPGLAAATVTGLAIDGDTLWVGTLHPAELGPVGSTGVLCRDLRTGRWTTLDAAGAWLPDKVVQAIAARDGTLFIATSDGLAAFDTRTGRWSVRYFSRTTIGGSPSYELVVRRPRH